MNVWLQLGACLGLIGAAGAQLSRYGDVIADKTGLGSNLFNILIIAIDDVVYLPGPILGQVSSTHAVSAISAMTMTGVAVAGLMYRPRARVLQTVGWASLLLFALYLVNSYLLYIHG